METRDSRKGLEAEMKALTNKAMFGRISRSSSVPPLSSGTKTNGERGIAVRVPLSLKVTFPCSKSSLETKYFHENISI